MRKSTELYYKIKKMPINGEVRLEITCPTCVRQELRSNRSRNFRYPGSGFLWYSLVPPRKFYDSTSIKSRPLLSKSFSILQPSYHPESYGFTTVSFDVQQQEYSFCISRKRNLRSEKEIHKQDMHSICWNEFNKSDTSKFRRNVRIRQF